MTNAAVSGSRSPRSAQGLRRRRSLLALAIVGSAGVSAPTAGTRAAERPDATSPAAPARIARDGPFDANVVVDLARALAGAPYVPPPASLPEVLAKLDYDQYREIQFRPSATLWARPGHTFQLQLLPLGYIFTTPVEIALVKDGRATHLAYSADLFVAGELVPGPLPTEDIGFSGFRLLYPIDERGRHDEVAVFQGASYFRSLGRDENYGLSARGLALKIGDPTGEEFPAFRAFWIEEPSRRSATAVVHALLDSPSVTGAYRFEIRPGQSTAMLVDAVLFPRVELKQVGIAPGTSMFFFGPNDRSGVDDFRPQVHDSDGLLVVNGRGERLWRPLSNPAKLQISAFSDRSPRGFGLVQRDRNPADFQDLESHFERRPSLWVEPSGDWGEGDVVLAEIPSSAEFHDNIVAFWRPRTPIPAGVPFHLSYRLSWGDEPPVALDRLRASRTAVGRADIKGPTPVRRFVVDYSPAPARCRGRCAAPMAVVTASAGKVGDVVVHDNPLTRGYRVSFTLDPEKAELSELRLELKFEDSRCAEIWLYRWTKR